jgi:hypothetical protein
MKPVRSGAVQSRNKLLGWAAWAAAGYALFIGVGVLAWHLLH